jgi:ssDNA-binding Zn-finger/Zn-ribbon topoisomerase 1
MEKLYFVEKRKYLIHVKCIECKEYMNQMERKEHDYYWINYQCPKCKKIISIEQGEVKGNTLHTNEVWEDI